MSEQEHSDTGGPSAEEASDVPPPVASASDAVEDATPSADAVVSEQLSQALKSILRPSGTAVEKGVVKFADEAQRPFVLYREPGGSEWRGVTPCSTEEILEKYKIVCQRHRTLALEVITKQIRKIEVNHNNSASLNLVDLNVDTDVVQTLDCVFENANFKTIYLGSCGNHALEMFEMLGYYDASPELVVTEVVLKDDYTVWQNFAVAIARCKSLKIISFREVSLGNPTIEVLFEQGINASESITTLRLDGCFIHRTPYFKLIDALVFNDRLVELHLCYTDLFSREMESIGKYLINNRSLKILDLSNNKIGDKGIDTLANAMLEQSKCGYGINVLLLYGNKLSRRCSKSINKLIACCSFLHTLNIGNNNLTDEILVNAKEYLLENNTLLAFGLQSTMLSCITIEVFQEIFHHNRTLQYMNLRGNKAIQPTSLSSFADIVQRSGLIHIELDDINRWCVDPQKYTELVNRIRGIVGVNKSNFDALELPQEIPYSEYVDYLSCDPPFVPKVLPVATSRAPTRGRFSVEPVPESAVSTGPRVMTIKPKPKGAVLKMPPPPRPLPEPPVFPKPIPIPRDLERRLEEVLGSGDMYSGRSREANDISLEGFEEMLKEAVDSGEYTVSLDPRSSSPPPRWERYAASSTVSEVSEASTYETYDESEVTEEEIIEGYQGGPMMYQPMYQQQGQMMYQPAQMYGQMYPLTLAPPGAQGLPPDVVSQLGTPVYGPPMYPVPPGMYPTPTGVFAAPAPMYPVAVYPPPCPPYSTGRGSSPVNVPVVHGGGGEGEAGASHVVERGDRKSPVPETEQKSEKK